MPWCAARIPLRTILSHATNFHATHIVSLAAHPYDAATMPAMKKLAPFLWFDHNAEDAAAFYCSVFPHAQIRSELRSTGVGPWPVGALAMVTLEIEGQEMVFLNGGPGHPHTPAFSLFVRCDSQEEIDQYWDKLLEGGKTMACGWLTDKFGLCWQIVPRQIEELVRHPKAMEAMMQMIKLDLKVLEAASKMDESSFQ